MISRWLSFGLEVFLNFWVGDFLVILRDAFFVGTFAEKGGYFMIFVEGVRVFGGVDVAEACLFFQLAKLAFIGWI